MTWRGYQVDRVSKRWTEDRVDRLAHLRCVEGKDWDEIARLMDSTPDACQMQASIHGLKLTPQARQLRRQR